MVECIEKSIILAISFQNYGAGKIRNCNNTINELQFSTNDQRNSFDYYYRGHYFRHYYWIVMRRFIGA